jgi:hypothetical protein
MTLPSGRAIRLITCVTLSSLGRSLVILVSAGSAVVRMHNLTSPFLTRVHPGVQRGPGDAGPFRPHGPSAFPRGPARLMRRARRKRPDHHGSRRRAGPPNATSLGLLMVSSRWGGPTGAIRLRSVQVHECVRSVRVRIFVSWKHTAVTQRMSTMHATYARHVHVSWMQQL